MFFELILGLGILAAFLVVGGVLLSYAVRVLVGRLPDLFYGFGQPGFVVLGLALVLCVIVPIIIFAVMGEVHDFDDVLLFGGISLVTLFPACLGFLWFLDTEPFCVISLSWYDLTYMVSQDENPRTDGARTYLIEQCMGPEHRL
ncbi:hypothetical protein ACERZ8_15120 [Tateyamaria armeniaca]|uniref:Uncharacterized protein n=1 Tax=Tateyamaria armeniaca TaxID=2518930 RepID=A0ABW8UZM4_9RHOB